MADNQAMNPEDGQSSKDVEGHQSDMELDDEQHETIFVADSPPTNPDGQEKINFEDEDTLSQLGPEFVSWGPRSFCRLCKAKGQDAEQFKVHLMGKKHREKILENIQHEAKLRLPELESPRKLPSVAFIQWECEKCPNALIGLKYITEHHAKGYEPVYSCELCSNDETLIVEDARRILTHVKTPWHRRNYMEKHHPDSFEQQVQGRETMNPKSWLPHLEFLSYEIELCEGRQKVKVKSDLEMFRCIPFKLPAEKSNLVGLAAPPATPKDPKMYIYENDIALDLINLGCYMCKVNNLKNKSTLRYHVSSHNHKMALKTLPPGERTPNIMAGFDTFEDYLETKRVNFDGKGGGSAGRKGTISPRYAAWAVRGGAAVRGALTRGNKAQRGGKSKRAIMRAAAFRKGTPSEHFQRDYDDAEPWERPLPPETPEPPVRNAIEPTIREKMIFFENHLRVDELDSRETAVSALRITNLLINKINTYQSRYGFLDDASLNILMAPRHRDSSMQDSDWRGQGNNDPYRLPYRQPPVISAGNDFPRASPQLHQEPVQGRPPRAAPQLHQEPVQGRPTPKPVGENVPKRNVNLDSVLLMSKVLKQMSGTLKPKEKKDAEQDRSPSRHRSSRRSRSQSSHRSRSRSRSSHRSRSRSRSSHRSRSRSRSSRRSRSRSSRRSRSLSSRGSRSRSRGRSRDRKSSRDRGSSLDSEKSPRRRGSRDRGRSGDRESHGRESSGDRRDSHDKRGSRDHSDGRPRESSRGHSISRPQGRGRDHRDRQDPEFRGDPRDMKGPPGFMDPRAMQAWQSTRDQRDYPDPSQDEMMGGGQWKGPDHRGRGHRGGPNWGRGRGHHPGDRGRGSGDRGRGSGDRGRGFGDRGRGSGDRGRGFSDRGRGFGDRGRGSGDRGRGRFQPY